MDATMRCPFLLYFSSDFVREEQKKMYTVYIQIWALNSLTDWVLQPYFMVSILCILLLIFVIS